MKKLVIVALGIFSCTELFGADCGLKSFFSKLGEQLSHEAYPQNSKTLQSLFESANRDFNNVLNTCTPSQEHTEEIIHYIARVGTKTMLNRFSKTPHFNGYDNIHNNVATPLMQAAFTGNIDLVEELLKNGANPDQKIIRNAKAGELDVITPTIAALRIPNEFQNLHHNPFFMLGHGPAIITLSRTRYEDYPYDNEIKTEDINIRPFLACLQLIRNASQSRSN